MDASDLPSEGDDCSRDGEDDPLSFPSLVLADLSSKAATLAPDTLHRPDTIEDGIVHAFATLLRMQPQQQQQQQQPIITYEQDDRDVLEQSFMPTLEAWTHGKLDPLSRGIDMAQAARAAMTVRALIVSRGLSSLLDAADDYFPHTKRSRARSIRHAVPSLALLTDTDHLVGRIYDLEAQCRKLQNTVDMLDERMTTIYRALEEDGLGERQRVRKRARIHANQSVVDGFLQEPVCGSERE
jgi:hypothetical protein